MHEDTLTEHRDLTSFVLYHPKTRTTGRAIAAQLGALSGTKCGRRYANHSVIIRWGNSREISATWYDGQRFRARTEINERKAVYLAGAKFRSLETLSAYGVNVPLYTRAPEIVQQDILEHGSTWYGRSFRHMGATDIVIYRDNAAFRGRNVHPDYFVRYVSNIKEYRVHVVSGVILLCQKKYFGEELFARIVADEFVDGDLTSAKIAIDYGEYDDFREECNLIRNNAHGWRFYDVKDNENVPEVIQNEALRAIDALGLDFGAVDVLLTKDPQTREREGVVLEVNTAPGLRERNLELYANALRNLVERMQDD